jgi:predicted Ser/Thr protein kinase
LLELSVTVDAAGEPEEPAPSRRAAPPAPADLAADFPQLEIIALVGEGGMGCVYRARHRQLERDVALKILAPGAEDDTRFEERFLREARALAKLDHPGIVRVHDFGKAGRRWFLVMEFVEGTNLRQLLREKRVAPREALAIVPQLCDALQYAHDEGVVHRDIKPENVLVDAKGRVKLADFGLAKLVDSDGDGAGRSRSDQVLGTLHYMAPEQSTRPRDVDHRADIYSLGVVFYEMLTGELPLGRFEPPSKRVRVDVRLDEIVLKSLERAPERRYQHAVDVRTDLDEMGATDPAPEEFRGFYVHAHLDGPVAQRVFWGATMLVCWVIYWTWFEHALASLAVLCGSIVAVSGMRSSVAPRWSELRVYLAIPVHSLGSVAFVVDRIHRWESATSDYFAQATIQNWIGFGGQRVRALAAESLGSGSYGTELVGSWHVGRWPIFEYEFWLPVAIALWLASAALLFSRGVRPTWRVEVREFGSALLLTGVTLAAALLAVVRPAFRAVSPVELAQRAHVQSSLEQAESAVKSLASDSELTSQVLVEWNVTDRDASHKLGRARLVAIESESPLKRWRFDLLRGPQRVLPRIAVTLVELEGRPGCEVEWHLGALASDQQERAAAWRELGASIVARIEGR